ncbi:hypothetical protein BV22DRAFT_502335 [Leucogyrophana mollusca]|uniref:Uncharacterized protein n=1 Tax=Leucogyrophana mollusca TaxID=85980 RepID=A0ACB8BFH0_9AGAM|nr:hypothetical protein BV22DRAFT_502335 [Leucogyrophana mollusca]
MPANFSRCSTASWELGTELGSANAIQRHYDWPSNTLWYGDIRMPLTPRRQCSCWGMRQDWYSRALK